MNTRELLTQLHGGRSRLPASTDTELLTALLADEPAADTVEALVQVLPRVRGAFSLVILDERRVIGVRDPHGFRPLVIGRIPAEARTPEARPTAACGAATRGATGWCIASETASLDIVGAEFVRDVEPGEIVVLEPGGDPVPCAIAEPNPTRVSSSSSTSPARTRTWRDATFTRHAAGWASSSPSSTPSTPTSSSPSRTPGAPAAAGYSEASGLPYREGMYRNRYAGRTFIQPSQGLRHRG